MLICVKCIKVSHLKKSIFLISDIIKSKKIFSQVLQEQIISQVLHVFIYSAYLSRHFFFIFGAYQIKKQIVLVNKKKDKRRINMTAYCS